MKDDYYYRKMMDTLEKLKHRKPMPEPINLLPPLPPIIRNKDIIDTGQFEIKSVGGHYEVYQSGQFYCSADTKAEAWDDVWSVRTT